MRGSLHGALARKGGSPVSRPAARNNPEGSPVSNRIQDPSFKYEIVVEDPKTHARAGILHTPHGDIETPIFMPVGTKANVKGIPTETVKDLGAQIVLANTYHLAMRPGADTIAELGGLHDFMNWHGPILTDSGGFQIFSHSDAVKLTDEGVRFIATDYDGSHVFWRPRTTWRSP